MSPSPELLKTIYNDLSELPVYTAAQFLARNVIRVTSSSRDHTRNAKRSSTKTIYTQVGVAQNLVSLSQDVSPEVLASIVSQSGKLIAILREISDSTGGKKRFVEVWAGDRLEVSVEVSKFHGSFYTDDQFHSLSFSPSENSLVYVAEENPPPADHSDSFARFRYLPDFGESLTGRKQPRIYICQWQIKPTSTSSRTYGTVKPLEIHEPSSAEIVFGQAVFAADDRIIATGYELTEDGHRLGIKGCFNRPAGIWDLSVTPSKQAPPESGEQDTSSIITSSAFQISDSARSSRSARIYRNPTSGSVSLYWISNALGGPHAGCSSLHFFDLTTGQNKLLLDTIFEVKSQHLGGFAGLYTDHGLPARPFLSLGNNEFIITHTVQGSRMTVVLVDAYEPQKVVHLTPVNTLEESVWSWNVLGTDGKTQVVCIRSSPTYPNELLLGQLTIEDGTPVVSWDSIDKPTIPEDVDRALKSLKSSVVPIPDRFPTETILIESPSKEEGKHPLVSFIHGGPHATSLTAFSPSIVAMALQGYALSLPNYTGSLGFGETYVRKLIGQCGTLDVQDVMGSIDHLVKLGIAEQGPGKQFAWGGSHGGFLGAHVIGQYPEVFSAAVLRNPVISCAQPAETDIPDWYFWEFGLPFTAQSEVTPELYKKLYPTSPIAYVDKVKAPVLLLIGKDDRRVAPTQGKSYYHALKGRGNPVDMLEFPGEGHPLEGVEAARISWEAAADWFAKATAK